MQTETSSSWRGWISLVGALVLGAVLLVAGYAKLLEPGAFAGQIRLEGLDFLLSASTVASLALGLEVGLGLALLLGIRSRWILIPSAALVAFFVFLTGRNYWLVSQGLRSPDAACGCFGSLFERTPAEAFWQDLFLLVPPLLLAVIFAQNHWFALPRKRFLASAVAGLATLLWTWTSADLRYAEEAAQIASSVQDSGFRQSEQYELRIGGIPSTGSQVYESESDPCILVLGSDLEGGLLIDPRDHKVRRFQDPESTAAGFGIEEVDRYPEVGEFSLTAEGISFELNGQRLVLGFRTSSEAPPHNEETGH